MKDPSPQEERRANVLVLVGPKGAGKTTLGEILEQEFAGVHFLEAEAIARRVLSRRGGVIDEEYARAAFEEIADEVERIAPSWRTVVIETTGASERTPHLIERLRQRHQVDLVRVNAGAETCATRIVERDSSRQVEVSPAMIRAMHERSESLAFTWALVVDNDPPLTRDEVVQAFRSRFG